MGGESITSSVLWSCEHLFDVTQSLVLLYICAQCINIIYVSHLNGFEVMIGSKVHSEGGNTCVFCV